MHAACNHPEDIFKVRISGLGFLFAVAWLTKPTRLGKHYGPFSKVLDAAAV